jgi:hypothetical protein
MSNLAKIRPLHIAKFAVPPYGGVEQHVDVLARALRPEIESTVLAGKLPSRVEHMPYKLYTVNSYGRIGSVYITAGNCQQS